MLSKERVHSKAFWKRRYASDFFLEWAKNENYMETGLWKGKKLLQMLFSISSFAYTPL